MSNERKICEYFQSKCDRNGLVDAEGLQKVLNYALELENIETDKTSRLTLCCVNCCIGICYAMLGGIFCAGGGGLRSSDICDWNRSEHSFSQEVCKGLINMVSNGESVKVGLTTFKLIWADILKWDGVYQQHYRSGTEGLDANGLKLALSDAGYPPNDEVFADMIKRRGERLVPFAGFVMCIIESKTQAR